MSLRDWLIIIALGAVWGGSFLLNAILLREIGPMWISAGRVGIGALGCWAIFFATKKTLPTSIKLYLNFFILGTMSYAIPFAIFPLSQQYIDSGVAAIVNAMTPLTTVIVSHFWLGGEKATRTKSLGVLAGFIGVFLMAGPALAGGGSSELFAIAACLSATLFYAVSLNYTRNFNHIDPTVLAACALSGAAISAIIAASLVEGIPHLATVEGWASMLGISLIATTVAFQIMYRMLPRIGATNFSVVTFIAPVSAIILGSALLDEKLQQNHFLGMLGIAIGLLLIDGRVFALFRKQQKSD